MEHSSRVLTSLDNFSDMDPLAEDQALSKNKTPGTAYRLLLKYLNEFETDTRVPLNVNK